MAILPEITPSPMRSTSVASCARAQARLGDAEPLRVGVGGEIAHDPVGDGLGVALGAAVQRGRLEELRGLALGERIAAS